MCRKLVFFIFVGWFATVQAAEKIPQPFKDMLEKVPDISFTGPRFPYDNAMDLLAKQRYETYADSEAYRNFMEYYIQSTEIIDSFLAGYYHFLKGKLLEKATGPIRNPDRLIAAYITRDPKSADLEFLSMLYPRFARLIGAVFSEIMESEQVSAYFSDLLKIKEDGTTFSVDKTKAQVLEDYLKFLRLAGLVDQEDVVYGRPTTIERLIDSLRVLSSFVDYISTRIVSKMRDRETGHEIYSPIYDPLLQWLVTQGFRVEQILLAANAMSKKNKQALISIRGAIQKRLAAAENSTKPLSSIIKAELNQELKRVQKGLDSLVNLEQQLEQLERLTYQLKELAQK